MGTTTLHSTSRNVILDVVVTDGRGRPVRGLTASDLTVTEDGRPQVIRMVDTSGGGADGAVARGGLGEGVPGSESRGGTGGARTVLLLDEINVRFFDLAFARMRMEAFLASRKAAGQPIAVMSMSGGKTTLVHDFTTDREALVRAVHKMPAVLPATGEGGIITGNVDPLRELENFRHAVGVLEQISSALKGTPDRINLLWITSGFPALTQMTSSSELQSTLDQLMQGTSNLFLEAKVTLYTIDPHGVQIESSLPNHNGQQYQGAGAGATNINTGEELLGNQINVTNSQAVANSVLGRLDQRTGRRSYGNMNDIDVPIGMAMEESASAYRVAYSPSDKEFDGKYRKIRVKVSRPGLTARTRDGYYATPEPPVPTPRERKLMLEEALESPFLFEGLRVTGSLMPGPARSTVEVTVGSAGLTRVWDTAGDAGGDEGTSHVRLTVAMAAFSGANRVLGTRVWEVEATGRKAVGGSLRYALAYPLPAGTMRLRVAVSDGSGRRTGTAEVPLGGGSGGL